MFPTDILAILSSYGAYQVQSQIKRYIIAAELHFYSFPYANIEVFNSFRELTANYPASGQRQYINVKQNPVIKNIILEPSTNWDISTTASVPQYLGSNQFNLSFLYNGRRLYYRYKPNTGVSLAVTSTTDQKYFENAKAAAQLQIELNNFLAVAQANQARLQQLSQANLTPLQRDIVNRAIVEHNFNLNSFAASLPNNVIVSGKNFSDAAITGAAIGVIPVIVWIVAIIVTALTVAITVTEIQKTIENTKKYKATLQANAQNIEKQLQAAQMLQAGQIDQKGYNDIIKSTGANMDANNKQLETMGKDAPGILDKAQNILFLFFAGMVALKFMDQRK